MYVHLYGQWIPNEVQMETNSPVKIGWLSVCVGEGGGRGPQTRTTMQHKVCMHSLRWDLCMGMACTDMNSICNEPVPVR